MALCSAGDSTILNQQVYHRFGLPCLDIFKAILGSGEDGNLDHRTLTTGPSTQRGLDRYLLSPMNIEESFLTMEQLIKSVT